MQADTRSKGSVPLLASRARFGYLTRGSRLAVSLKGMGGMPLQNGASIHCHPIDNRRGAADGLLRASFRTSRSQRLPGAPPHGSRALHRELVGCASQHATARHHGACSTSAAENPA